MEPREVAAAQRVQKRFRGDELGVGRAQGFRDAAPREVRLDERARREVAEDLKRARPILWDRARARELGGRRR